MYTTKQVANIFKIHPNTIRHYEKVQFISAVHKRENGYREFCEMHIKQIAILRLIFLGKWPGVNIRLASLRLAQELPSWQKDNLLVLTDKYIEAIEIELKKVKQALFMINNKNKFIHEDIEVDLGEAAKVIGVTKDVIRNWERNSLFKSKRTANNKKFVTGKEMTKLKIIYYLRLSGFSMSAVYNYINDLGQLDCAEVLSAGDQILEFLNKTLDSAKKIYDNL